MRPLLEKLTVAEDASWRLLDRRLDDGIPFQWHYHDEFELTLTLNSRGLRYVGDHIGEYGDQDLVLVGSKVPHSWSSTERLQAGEPHVALVMWFRPEWIRAMRETLPELARLDPLLRNAGRGVLFSSATAAQVTPIVGNMLEVAPLLRLSRLLEVFQLLIQDRERCVLASPAFSSMETGTQDRAGIDRVLAHIHAHYREAIPIATLAELACLSASALHRMFRRHVRMTVSDYVAQLRIGQACSLLITTDRPVAHIAEQVGYASQAHFNRQFRELRQLTPRAFRAQFQRP